MKTKISRDEGHRFLRQARSARIMDVQLNCDVKKFLKDNGIEFSKVHDSFAIEVTDEKIALPLLVWLWWEAHEWDESYDGRNAYETTPIFVEVARDMLVNVGFKLDALR